MVARFLRWILSTLCAGRAPGTWVLVAVAALGLAAPPTWAHGQGATAKPRPAPNVPRPAAPSAPTAPKQAAPPAAKTVGSRPAAKSKAEEIPAPVELKGQELLTRDGVLLRATFYPSNRGKEAIPVILLHGWKGNRAEFAGLARELQKLGHAVLVPDLRGHGESIRLAYDDRRELKDTQISRTDVANMVRRDMEKLKSFLVQKNNAGELNLEKLCVVGSEMGAVVALNWAVWDWHWPAYPDFKQGQYVKALVLISPPWSFKGVDISEALNFPAIRGTAPVTISVQIIYGAEDRKVAGEVERMARILQQHRPQYETEEDIRDKQDFFVRPVAKTSLQGTKLLNERTLPLFRQVFPAIAAFIHFRLENKDFPWHEIKERR